MNLNVDRNELFEMIWKIPIIAAIYTVTKTISWTIVTEVGMPFPEIEGHEYSHVLGFLSVLVLSACLVLLARGIGGSPVTRWLILMAFTYVSFVINNQIEGLAFTTTAEAPTMLLFFILPCVAATIAAVLLVRTPESDSALQTIFSDPRPAGWWWRPLIAWAAFPLIYYVFGALIYPLVAETYAQPDSGLQVPSQAVVLGAVSIRSLFFLAATIPIIVNWRLSRRALILSLAAAFTAMVGAVGLIESSWLPMTLRIVHSLEIAADSLVYAWVLVALLVPRTAKTVDPSEDLVAVG